MSATFETPSWRKRHREEDNTSQMDLKKPRLYYYRLESESSKASEEDTESVYSVQGKETDVVRDTTDTDSKSDSDQEYEVIEYEVASLSESDNDVQLVSSSGSEDMILAAAAICDSSLEKWLTDGEESDNSSLDETSLPRLGFTMCLQCKSKNNNPLYTYCEKCFQSCRQCKIRKTYKGFPLCISCHKDRKRFFPPRPRGHRKSKKPEKKKSEPPVKLDVLRSCLSGLSQDSGVGSSQECPPLDLDQIIVPDKHLKISQSSKVGPSLEKISEQNENPSIKEAVSTSSFSSNASTISRKRTFSESSLSDFELKKPEKMQKKNPPLALSQGPEVSNGSLVSLETSLSSENLLDKKSLSQTLNMDSGISTCSILSLESTTSPSENLLKVSSSSLSLISEISENHTNSSDILKNISSLTSSADSGISSCNSVSSGKSTTSENSELCIFCNNAPKDSIFLHTNIAHQCCCYKCAKRTLQTIKRCPICNRSVNKVVKIFTM